MTPFQLAWGVYLKEHCARSFEQDLRTHLAHGFVFSTPDFFVMGRPVVRDAYPALIVDPSVCFEREKVDCWHVYLAAGNLAKAWSILPYDLPWLSFERKNELRFCPTASIKRLCGS